MDRAVKVKDEKEVNGTSSGSYSVSKNGRVLNIYKRSGLRLGCRMLTDKWKEYGLEVEWTNEIQITKLVVKNVIETDKNST